MEKVIRKAERNVNEHSVTYRHTEKALGDGCPALHFVEKEGFNLNSIQTIL